MNDKHYENEVARVEAEFPPAFDYVSETLATCSNQYHGELVSQAKFNMMIKNAIASIQALDRAKKALFYGKDAGLSPLDGNLNVTTLPYCLSNATGAETIDYIHGVFGVITEAGELLEALDKSLFETGMIDRQNGLEECGDTKWYLALLSRVFGFRWGDDERANIAKLRAKNGGRYAAGEFTEDQAINRNTEAEMAALDNGYVTSASFDHAFPKKPAPVGIMSRLAADDDGRMYLMMTEEEARRFGATPEEIAAAKASLALAKAETPLSQLATSAVEKINAD